MKTRVLLAAFFLAACAGTAAAQNGSGTVTTSATASEYLDVSIGGSATLSGNSGGSVSGTQTSGAPLELTVDLGEVTPTNANAFAKIAIPLRLQSNVAYDLKLTATDPGNTGDQLVLSDFGFGLGPVSRTDTGVDVEGTDTITAAIDGDPSLASEATPGGRWDWAAGRSLDSFTTAATILTGNRIMEVVPQSDAGLRVTSYVVVKPQFYKPSSFSTTLTFTIAAGS